MNNNAKGLQSHELMFRAHRGVYFTKAALIFCPVCRCEFIWRDAIL